MFATWVNFSLKKVQWLQNHHLHINRSCRQNLLFHTSLVNTWSCEIMCEITIVTLTAAIFRFSASYIKQIKVLGSREGSELIKENGARRWGLWSLSQGSAAFERCGEWPLAHMCRAEEEDYRWTEWVLKQLKGCTTVFEGEFYQLNSLPPLTPVRTTFV